MVQKNSIVWNNDYKSDGILYFTPPIFARCRENQVLSAHHQVRHDQPEITGFRFV